MDLDQAPLGALIRKRRKELGLTLNDLANEQISVPTISNIERGIIYNVREEKLSYLKERLGLTDDEIERLLKKTKKERQDLKRRLSIARHLIQLKLYEEARKELSALEDEDNINEYPHYSINLQLQKGVLYRKLGQWERAKRTLHNVISLAQEAELEPKTNIVAEAYHFLSLCAFYGDQDYEKAIEYIELTLDAFQEEGEKPFIKGQALCDKANYYFHLGRYGSAYKYVLEARKISEQQQDIRVLLLEYNLEGVILSRQQMYESAIETFDKAIALARTHYPEPEMASLLYLNISDVYYRASMYDQSLHYLDLAYKLCRMTKDTYISTLVYTTYGQVYYETKEFEKANENVNKATELASKFELTSEYLQLVILKAKIALANQSDEIESICQEGIRLTKEPKLYRQKKEFHMVLAKYYDRYGNKEQFLRETENLFHTEQLLQGEELN